MKKSKERVSTFIFCTVFLLVSQLIFGYLVCTYWFERSWNILDFINNPIIIGFWCIYILGSGYWLGFKQGQDDYDQSVGE